MVRVVIVSRIYVPEPASASFRLHALTNALIAQGADVEIKTSRFGDVQSGKIDGAAVNRWPVRRARDGAVRGYIPYASFDIPALFRLLATRRPDIVVAEPPPTTGLVAAIACRLRRAPFVYYAADCWTDAIAATNSSRSVVVLVRMLERFVLRQSAVVLTVNEGIAARLREIAPTTPVEVVGNGVDTTYFGATEEIERTLQGPPTVVYTGTASEWQGAEIFVEAWPAVARRHSHARLRFIGGGTSWPLLRSRAVELGVADLIDFVDTVPPSLAGAHLRAATLAVVSLRPGQSYDYALPTKLLAAVACGTPALYVGEGIGANFVATIDPGARAGTVTTGFDKDAVSKAIIAILDSPAKPDERRALAEWASGRVSLSAVAERAASVITSTAGVRR